MLPKLTAILSGATGDRRIRSIRVLEFHYVTDLMAPAQHSDSELGEQEHLPNEFFSEDMKALFGLLKGWEERLGGSERVAAERYQLSLFLGRGWGTDVPDLPLTPPPTEDIVRAPWPDVRYIGEEKLPELSLVSWVTLCERHGIHPESLMQIVSRMKYLDRFEGDIFEEGWSLGRTREYRKVLGECLHLLPRSISLFHPDFLPSVLQPRTLYPVLVDPQRDHLCISIRTLSCQLRKLNLSGLRISPAIFAGDGDGSYPDWSSLQEVIIGYPVISSTGQWFANRAPPEVVAYVDPDDDDGYCTYYAMPNPKLLNELYAAAGKAKQHTPSLKSMHLTLDVDIGKHKFIYYFNQERKRNMITLESGIPFEFSEEVAEAWGFSLDAVNSIKEGNMTFYEGGVTVNEVIVA
ncbi:hypothetical protein VE00_00278 [Pseudogymnoascus sp. WSF 3629]|nr:hypothetical protein VE00_00278 [Pseudogymnoascus sp. WSF 3629]